MSATEGVWTAFGLTAVVLAALLVEAGRDLSRPWARPAIGVYLTVMAWYLLDFLYNGQEQFARQFADDVVIRGFVLVGWFLVAFRGCVWATCHSIPPGRLAAGRRSPRWETKLVTAMLVSLAGLTAVALLLADTVWTVVFPPFAEVQTSVWSRGGVGAGGDFLLSAAAYVHIALVGMLGAVAVITRRPMVRTVALAVFVLCLPPFLFQRARNTMLAVLMPGVLAFLLDARRSMVVKAAFAGVAFMAINTWFLVVISVRDVNHEGWLRDSVSSYEADVTTATHGGLDMLSELCHIVQMTQSGHYQPNLGSRYLAEVAMPIPRLLWPNKPLVGIDYALARGFADASKEHGVAATVATGMIGQGVVNFGQLFGVLAAALLMSLWVGMLARLWAYRADPARHLLFLLGVGLTFNMGRDITLMVTFPFFAAWAGLRVFEWVSGEAGRR